MNLLPHKFLGLFLLVFVLLSCEQDLSQNKSNVSLSNVKEQKLGTLDQEIVGVFNGSLYGGVVAEVNKLESTDEVNVILLIDSNSTMKHIPMFKATIEYFVFKHYELISNTNIGKICMYHRKKEFENNGICFDSNTDNDFKEMYSKLKSNQAYVEALEYLISKCDYDFFVNMEAALMGIRKYNNPDDFYKGKFIEMLPIYYSLKSNKNPIDSENVIKTFNLLKSASVKLKDEKLIKVISDLESIDIPSRR